MVTSLEDLLAARPVDRDEVERHKRRMREEIRAYRLQEFRKAMELTQRDLAERIGVGQNRVSNIERGQLERVHIDTLRRYVEAVGGSLHIEVEIDDLRFELA